MNPWDLESMRSSHDYDLVMDEEWFIDAGLSLAPQKHKVIAKKTLHPQRGDILEESTQEMGPPLTVAPMPPRGQRMVKQLYCSSSEVLINTYYQNEVVVEELKKGGASSTIGKVEAQATELMCQLEDVHLVGLTKHLKEVRGHNRIMEDELLRLIRELDMVKKHNSKLIEEFGYQIPLTCFKVRDPKLELEEDPFIEGKERKKRRLHGEEEKTGGCIVREGEEEEGGYDGMRTRERKRRERKEKERKKGEEGK
ncbi:hypothetical protein GW17_00024778 [Ensete ventricosum]|nr:hypothetical protein GW17_00024778 [Ensete ventricosum]RZS19496.1 hypothetical protein BHM03_00051893 [Ensete ventricosum]